MTIDEAIRILDPETTREALFGIERDEAIPLVEDACRLACEALRAVKKAGIYLNTK